MIGGIVYNCFTARAASQRVELIGVTHMYYRTSPGKSNTLVAAAWILVCAGMLLCGMGFVAWSAGVVSLTQIFGFSLSYLLISSGLLFTLYELRQ
jgi:hypothetical protein